MKRSSASLLVRVVSVALLPAFIFSFSAPQFAEASVNQLNSPAILESHPFASQINRTALRVFGNPTNQWIIKEADFKNRVVIDAHEANKLYLLEETRDGQTLTIRYLYDTQFQVVTLLLSISPVGEEVSFTHYYRYLLGPNYNLSLILEEGWVKEDLLLPSKLYDYYRDGLGVRFFDKEGKLLRIDNSDGFEKRFFYSQNGKLLTIQEVDPLGQITFNDQLFKDQAHMASKTPFLNLESLRYTLPSREKEKRLSLASFINHIADQTLENSPQSFLLGESHQSFLAWLEAAYPTRAGPGGSF